MMRRSPSALPNSAPVRHALTGPLGLLFWPLATLLLSTSACLPTDIGNPIDPVFDVGVTQDAAVSDVNVGQDTTEVDAAPDVTEDAGAQDAGAQDAVAQDVAADVPTEDAASDAVGDVDPADADGDVAEDVDPDAEDVDPDAEDVDPDAEDVDLDAEDVDPDAEDVDPDAPSLDVGVDT